MSTTTIRLPHPHNGASYVSVFIATAVAGERFIAAMGTLVEAKVMAEADDEATAYFADDMAWVESDPLPPLPGHGYGRRQWIGSVVTTPYGSPTQFRIVQQCVEDLSMYGESQIPGFDREKVSAEVAAERKPKRDARKDRA